MSFKPSVKRYLNAQRQIKYFVLLLFGYVGICVYYSLNIIIQKTAVSTSKSFTSKDTVEMNSKRQFNLRVYGIIADIDIVEAKPHPKYDFSEGNEIFKYCEFKNCKIVTAHGEAQVVVVETMALDWGLIPPPLPKLDGQLWIAYTWEPPPIMRNLPWQKLEHHFHLTASYRRSSDIYCPYGSFYVKKPSQPGKTSIFDYLEKKSKKVAWFVSNCKPQSERQRYVNELSKFIQIDIYGKCGNNTCERWQRIQNRTHPCFDMLKNEYKFYLAFENSFCEDYVTEKVWVALGRAVPIVMGLVNYSDILPPHSFIDVRDFSSAQSLAEYLHALDKDPAQYERFFEWTRTYDCYYGRHVDSWQCRMCDYLNKHTFSPHELEYPNVSLDDITNVTHACVTPDFFYRNIL